MVNVYFKPAGYLRNPEDISSSARELLERTIAGEGISLHEIVPLKVHFGEKGNTTYIKPENYEGIIGLLKEKNIESCFIETNVLYKSPRTRADTHKELAIEHGFTSLPIEIADGVKGEDYVEVKIEGKHFRTCKLGRLIAEEKQIIVLSHFKGHVLAGFGGAIKQLGMGCAARPGKLDQHAGSKPSLNPLKCRKCMTCVSRCPRNAIEIGLIPRIRKDRCIGCASCIEACTSEAISVNWLATLPRTFREKLAEYALAAHKEGNVYVNYAVSITKDCDCDGRSFKPIVEDLGLFASVDPVAVDKACWDLLNKREGRKVFGGENIFRHAERIGLGTTKYELVEI